MKGKGPHFAGRAHTVMLILRGYGTGVHTENSIGSKEMRTTIPSTTEGKRELERNMDKRKEVDL